MGTHHQNQRFSEEPDRRLRTFTRAGGGRAEPIQWFEWRLERIELLERRVIITQGKVFIRYVLTHPEYDAGRWKAGCGC